MVSESEPTTAMAHNSEVEERNKKYIKEVLEICYEVRRLLVVNGVKNLGEDFPIHQSRDGGMVHDNHYLGWAHVTRDSWTLVDKHHMVSSFNKTNYVEVCLVDHISHEPYTLDRILPTLLHEFAHCVTPGIQVYGAGGDGKGKREWTSNSHDDNFYENFSQILDVAEKLGIYKLPSSFCKNNKQSLRRFDAVDVDGKNVFIGHTTLFKEFVLSHSPSSSSSSTLPQKIVIANEKGETKLVVLNKVEKDKLLEELKDGCVRKFQIKKKKAILKFVTQKGTVIEDSDTLCKCVEQQDQIVFRIT